MVTKNCGRLTHYFSGHGTEGSGNCFLYWLCHLHCLSHHHCHLLSTAGVSANTFRVNSTDVQGVIYLERHCYMVYCYASLLECQDNVQAYIFI